ncbi:MAG TPA: hypothetical protein VMS31_15780, partial [Pyrinomonadaceae bacterium]|nr:hypothetical protein [Pyrinomonadaceae bacterium]
LQRPVLQLMRLGFSNLLPALRLTTVILVGVWSTLAGSGSLFSNSSSTALAQQASGRSAVSFPTTIQWIKQNGVSKYRLQIADGENFRNIFYDGRVVGDRYSVRGLAPGYYYWRIAPAERQTGNFSKPVRFFVSGGFVISGTPKRSHGERSRVPLRNAPKAR